MSNYNTSSEELEVLFNNDHWFNFKRSRKENININQVKKHIGVCKYWYCRLVADNKCKYSWKNPNNTMY